MRGLLMLIGAVLMVASCAFAELLPDGGPYTETVDGIEWTFMVRNGAAILGTGCSWIPAVSNDTEGAICVPQVLGGRVVSSIEAFAFLGCGRLTSVTIPPSVTVLWNGAFCYCTNLVYVTIPSSVNHLDAQVFRGCSKLADIPQSVNVTNIGDMAFCECNSLVNITIPPSVTGIGSHAFAWCTKLTTVEIGKKVRHISSDAFFLSNNVQEINVDPLNEDLSSRDGVLFNKDMTALIVFPSGMHGVYSIPMNVKTIGDMAFYNCRGLEGVALPHSLTNIGYFAFGFCKNVTKMTIPPDVLTIGDNAFFHCDGLESMTIPEGVCDIGNSSFEYCISMTSAVIPSSVRKLSQKAFSGCLKLKSVVLSDGVENIGDSAFKDCFSLTAITIPKSVTSIGSSVFEGSRMLLSSVDFEGAPPEGLSSARIKQDAAIRYNITYSTEWANAIEECGFTNATPYVPETINPGETSEFTPTGWSSAIFVPNDWLIATGVAKEGDASVSTMAKLDAKGKNGISRYQSYVLGMIPDSDIPAKEQLKVMFKGFDEMGVPIINYEPTPNDASHVLVKELGRTTLPTSYDTEWTEIPSGCESDYNFFKVSVEVQETLQ